MGIIMVDGFKDKDGKFRPTVWSPKKNGIKKGSIDSSTTSNNAKYKLQEYYHFDDLSESAKEKALEDARNNKAQFSLEDFADFDGIIYDEKTGFTESDVFTGYTQRYYDLDRGHYIQFPDLEVKDENKLLKMLGLPKSILEKITISFISKNEQNTEIEFDDGDGGLAIGGYDPVSWKEYEQEVKRYGDENPLTKKEFTSLEKAVEKWDNLMDSAWKSLRDNYEYQLSDEAVEQDIEANEWQFDKEGNMV
tara:strand:+ start:400 stop:1146 length:747 start_codon:yes stop_codon:yes gene_type:complete